MNADEMLKWWHKGGHRLMAKYNHYFEIYSQYFHPFIGKSPKILELGVHSGGSLQFWREYFGAGSQIVGVDIDPNCKYIEPQITVEIGSQNDRPFIEQILNTHGPFDIVIDDASHEGPRTLESFNILYPQLTERGVYFLEDLHCSMWPSMYGDPVTGGGLISHFQGLMADLATGPYHQDMTYNYPPNLDGPQSDFVKMTKSIQIFPICIVVQRGGYGKIGWEWH